MIPSSTSIFFFQADGTKSHSQEPDQSYNDIAVTVADDGELLDVSVNDGWEKPAEELDEIDAVADDATIVSDADRELREAFVMGERCHQLDLVHLVRTTGYKLWQDDQLSLDEREEVLDSLEGVLYPLAAAVEWTRETDASAASWLRLSFELEITMSTANRILGA